MKKIFRTLLLLIFMALCAIDIHAATPKISVLIIDGQNNHKWVETTQYLKAILDNTGLFSVDVSTSPPAKPKAPVLPKNATAEQMAAAAIELKTLERADAARLADTSALWANWRPRFAQYDVVVSNYNGENWPEEVRTALIAFVKNGGGFVSYHAANNAFSQWPEYSDMVGLGGWGGHTPQSGPYLRLRDGTWTKLEGPGPSGAHGPQQEFLIENFAPHHPIMKGLPAQWMHAKDELYNSLRGPANNMSVLGSALSDQTHEQEPLLMALSYGKGRVFHTALGHYIDALNGLGFQVTFARGVEWAATGKVTLPAPKPGELTERSPAALRKIQLPNPGPNAAIPATSEEGFTSLFNGKDFDNWDLKIRNGDAELAKKVFAIDNGMVHVFKDFPDNYELGTGVNATHAMLYTKKKFSKFILRFDYKWGKKIANNFDRNQYDSGLYYHIMDDKIWPVGIEYQIRYNHLLNKNHTGDFWANGLQWFADEKGNFLLPQDGGKALPGKKGELPALPGAPFHALDDQWNVCEIIVMGDQYAIQKLNGEIVNLATNLSQSEGILGFQAETAEIYFRDIRIKEFNEIVPMKNFFRH